MNLSLRTRFIPLMLFLATALAATTAMPAAARENSKADRGLQKIFDADWERRMKRYPTWASSLGDMRYNDRWTDMSMVAIERDHQDDLKLMKSLNAVKTRQLSPDMALNYQLFSQELQESIDNFPYQRYLIPLNQRGGIQSANDLASRITFTSVKHYEDWIARLSGIDTYVDQTIALMEKGIKEKIVHPRVIMERVPAQIEKQIVKDPTDSPFYSPFKNKPDGLSEAEFSSLNARGKTAITNVVIPAYQRFADFFNNTYLPACRDTVGVWDTPKGKQYYEQRVKDFTTTNLTPDEVHEIGLSEVSRIRGEMQKIIDELEFAGDFAAFLHFLRTDPQFYHETPEALLQDYLATSKRIDPELVKLFSDLPRTPYGVKAIPDAIAPDTTTAYYSQPAADGSRAGYYYVNLYRPEVRPKYEIEVLTVHEAMPGHHLQIALAQELGELPKFRRFGGYTAFVEGWGLYSESLGGELGLYKDPYSKFGQLTYEMWRAVRLVVDTGIHYNGWDRQKAIDFFKANAAKAEYDIINEIDRYIAWPGQALAYKIGELKIKELKKRSQTKLGEKFDIKAFHKVVLGSGAVPLSVLEQNVDAWIAQAGDR